MIAKMTEAAAPVRERAITFSSHGRSLAGTLALPAADSGDRVPAALLVVGSGPIDRDSNLPRLQLRVTALIAERLAHAGIATLRYDKRGVGGSEGDYHATGLGDNIEDATQAYRALIAQPEVDADRTFAVGHSEGAVIALELAAGDLGLRGAVLLAGMAQTGEAVLRWQASRIAGHAPWLVRAILKVLRVDLEKVQSKRFSQLRSTTEDSVRIQLVKINAKWFREFLGHDPADALRRLTCPTLAITGTNDLQVDYHDIDRMAELAPEAVQGQIVQGMNHILRKGPPSPQTYRKQTHLPLAEEALVTLEGWLATHSVG